MKQLLCALRFWYLLAVAEIDSRTIMGKFKQQAKSDLVQYYSPFSCSDFINDTVCNITAEKDLKAMNGIIVAVALAEFLVVAILLAYVLIRREYKSVLERLYIYLVLATLLREAVLLSNVEYQFGYDQKDQDHVCSILGALNLYTHVLIVVIVASTMIYLPRRVAYKNSNSAVFDQVFELGFVILTFLVPLIISVSLFRTDIYGLSTAWCWLRQQCQTSPLKRVLAGYGNSFALIGILCTASMLMIYCKIARQIKQAKRLLRQAVILLTCLIVHLAIAILVIILTSTLNQKYITSILYIQTLVVCTYDTYPLGFLISLKCQAVVLARKRRATYTSLPRSIVNASAPASERVSADSNTTPRILEYTGEFTYIEPLQRDSVL